MKKDESTTRALPVRLTDHEIQMYGEEQARELILIERLEEKRGMINEAIKPRKKRVSELARMIDSKTEERSVDCLWVYDWERGRKRLIRTDTREAVETRRIDAEENQADMFSADDAELSYGQ